MIFPPHMVSGSPLIQNQPVVHWTLEKIAGIGANLATIGALIFAGIQMRMMARQLKESRSAAKISRSLDFSRRWNELEFVKFRTPLYVVLLKVPNPTLDEIQTAINTNADIKSGIRLVLNFYEEMGLVYNRRHADVEILRSQFKEQICTLCTRAKPYIDFRRETQPDLWVELLKMNAEISKSS